MPRRDRVTVRSTQQKEPTRVVFTRALYEAIAACWRETRYSIGLNVSAVRRGLDSDIAS